MGDAGLKKSRTGGVVIRPGAFAGDDRALVESARAGDERARAALYDRHAAYVARVLVRMLGSDADLEDLLQEVFAEALASLGALRELTSLRSWLAGIAVNRARKHIRKRARWRWIVFWPAEEIERTPREPSEASEALRATYQILDRLEVDDRVALTLRFFEGMDLAETAVATGVSLATVKRRLFRGRARFFELARERPELAEWIGDPERSEGKPMPSRGVSPAERGAKRSGATSGQNGGADE